MQMADQLVERSTEQQQRLRNILVVLLAMTSGATDAIGFLALGGAFTSVMTGNMVLLGISAAWADGTLAGHTAVAIVCFIGGCALGVRLAGTHRAGDPVWPVAVTRALAVEAAVLLAYAAGWWATGSAPRGTAQLVLLAMNAVAVGIQSSTVQRFGVPGLSTTYLTGTLTTLIIRISSGHRIRDVAHSAQLLLGLVGGAALGALLVDYAPAAAPLVQLGCVGTVLAAATITTRPG